MKKETSKKRQQHHAKKPSSHRNRPLHIPLDFETAIEGLMKVKPKKDQKAT